VDSCAPDGMRWRSKHDLNGGEAFDNLHSSATERTGPEWVRMFYSRRNGGCGGLD
jgi:hypothetical protein